MPVASAEEKGRGNIELLKERYVLHGLHVNATKDVCVI